MVKRILVVSHTYAAPINHDKLKALAERDGVEVGLLAPASWPDTLGQMRLRPDFPSEIRLFTSRVLFAGNGRRYLVSPKSLLAALGQFRPDIVHVEEEPDSLALTEVSLMKRFFGYKIVFFTWENLMRRPRIPLLEIVNLRSAEGAIAGSVEAKEVLRNKGFSSLVSVLPQLGVDAERFSKREISSLKEQLGLNAFTIGYIGRLVEEKGLMNLLEAVAAIEAEFKLLLVGRGPLKRKLAERASQLGMSERVVFVDAVAHEEIPNYLSCLDVLVLPSLTTRAWKEQFGHILIEAMACEVPVIGSDSGAIPEVIGEAGLVFPEASVADLAGRLKQILEDASLRNSLAQKGRQRVLDNYTHAQLAAATHRFYAEVCVR
jgi:glycosyltransferase involved in cell wall biosynthesis